MVDTSDDADDSPEFWTERFIRYPQYVYRVYCNSRCRSMKVLDSGSFSVSLICNDLENQDEIDDVVCTEILSNQRHQMLHKSMLKFQMRTQRGTGGILINTTCRSTSKQTQIHILKELTTARYREVTFHVYARYSAHRWMYERQEWEAALDKSLMSVELHLKRIAFIREQLILHDCRRPPSTVVITSHASPAPLADA